MTGLFGWFTGTAELDAAKTLDAMAQAAQIHMPLDTASISSATALAAWQTNNAVSVLGKDGINVVLIGSAHWESAELQSLAAQNGLAASVIEAYRRYGKDFLQHLHGVFAVALVDTQKQLALLAIDRLGTQPLAFAQAAHGLVFSSDARAVAVHPEVNSEISPQGVFNYIYFHMVPSPGSIFTGVQKLLPGECVIWQQGQLQRHFYWQLKYQDNGTAAAFKEKAEHFKALLKQAVTTAADAPETGAFLSGGTDSSTVVGMLTQSLGRPIDTFSIGFDAEGYDEMEYARIASKRFGTRPHEYYLTPADVVAAIPKIAAAYDEPFGNASVIPTYYCAKLAHDAGIKVMLAGDGGDEIFGGNARYAKQKVFELYGRIPAWARQGLIEPLTGALPGLGLLNKVKSYVAQARIPLPDRLETYNFLHREPLNQILSAEFLAQIKTNQPETLLREVYGRADSQSYINRMLHLDMKFTLADNDLRKVNRAAELAGIAVRYPLLDEALVAFSAALTPDEKVRGQYLRYFFKQALKDFLPDEIINKSKHGFGLPFGLWMQTNAELHALAGDSLTSLRQRNLVRPEYINQLLNQHQSGDTAYYGVMIWVLMMLEQWLQAQPLRK
ncbi:MAG: asparagine synthase (glutamine-hydrolyzing) [Methylophilaceae bacterium]|nr:asparagine synthase (glutamine-hydrolyzing) [Methylophilaceae bacterium]